MIGIVRVSGVTLSAATLITIEPVPIVSNLGVPDIVKLFWDRVTINPVGALTTVRLISLTPLSVYPFVVTVAEIGVIAFPTYNPGTVTDGRLKTACDTVSVIPSLVFDIPLPFVATK